MVGLTSHPGASGSALAPADAALTYVRERLGQLLPIYTWSMAPATVVVLWIIDLTSSQYRRTIPAAAACMMLALCWRWLWLSLLQRRIVRDVSASVPDAPGRHLLPYLLIKLVAGTLAMWGSLLIVPGCYGLLLGGCALPLVVDQADTLQARVRRLLVWTGQAQLHLAKLMTSLGVLFLLTWLGAWMSLQLIVGVLLPQFVGLDGSELGLTLRSWPAVLLIGWVVYLVFDLYWNVLAVMLYYHLQARRLAPDLRVRLQLLRAAEHEA